MPAENDDEKYETSDKNVYAWVKQVISAIEESGAILPILIHCRSGRDRTGVIVAAILWKLGVSNDVIIEEFKLSPKTKSENIIKTLDGLEQQSSKKSALVASKLCSVLARRVEI